MQRACWFASVVVLCTSLGATIETPLLKLDEDNIRIRILPGPVLELPVVNNAGKPLEGNFRPEFLDSDGNSAAWTTGTLERGDASPRARRKLRASGRH